MAIQIRKSSGPKSIKIGGASRSAGAGSGDAAEGGDEASAPTGEAGTDDVSTARSTSPLGLRSLPSSPIGVAAAVPEKQAPPFILDCVLGTIACLLFLSLFAVQFMEWGYLHGPGSAFVSYTAEGDVGLSQRWIAAPVGMRAGILVLAGAVLLGLIVIGIVVSAINTVKGAPEKE